MTRPRHSTGRGILRRLSAQPGRGARGFTLLEVMITLAILGMSLTAISRSQQNSVRMANRAKWITVASLLARSKMVEVEDQLYEKGFSEFEEEDSGDFKEDGFDHFTYTVKVDKVELPAEMNPQSLTDSLGMGGDEGGGDDGAGQGNAMMSMGSQILASQFELIRATLEQSIRRVQLKVNWKEGTRTKAVTVVAYFTDPRKVDAAASGQLTINPSGAAQTGGVTGNTGSSGSSTSSGSRTSSGGSR